MRSTSPTPHEPGVWQKVLFRKTGKIYFMFTTMVIWCCCCTFFLVSMLEGERGRNGTIRKERRKWQGKDGEGERMS